MSTPQKSGHDAQSNPTAADQAERLPLTDEETERVTGGIVIPKPQAFLCKSCGIAFNGADAYHRHMATHHPD